ncbi:MAG: hypothetical protein RL685_1230 [Pseudomonadota bacterium]|jgi:serine/threonine-protein kinase
MRPLEAGQLLGDKYRLVQLLGQGGMGCVWHAQHLTLNAPVALKFIEAEDLDAAALQRFLREARVAAALRSPHVVQILDYGIEDQRPHIAMELLEGETLAARLGRLGCLDLQQVSRVIQQVSRAIARAHDEGVIHRDLKPENVFIVHNDDDELIKVLDFGIAKSTHDLLESQGGSATRTGTMVGTPHYMSPEQVEGAKSIDVRTDLWSLGVLAYRCLLGELPFTGDTIGSVALAICSRPLPIPSRRGTVPAGFDAWFARACARDPDQRFDSARVAASEFLELAAHQPAAHQPAAAQARRASPPVASVVPPTSTARAPSSLGFTTTQATSSDPSRPAARRKRRLWVALPLVLALGVGALALTLLRSSEEPRWGLAPAPNPAAQRAPTPTPTPTPTSPSARAVDSVELGAPSRPSSTQPIVRPVPMVQPLAASPAAPPAPADPARKAAPPSAPPRVKRSPSSAAAAPAAAERAPAERAPAAQKPPAAPPGMVPAAPAADTDLGI